MAGAVTTLTPPTPTSCVYPLVTRRTTLLPISPMRSLVELLAEKILNAPTR